MPLKSLLILSICLININKVIIIDGKIKCGLSKNHNHKGVKIVAINAERDDFLYTIATSNHIKQVTNPARNENTSIIPMYVATPLPPLNFCHIGNK